MSQEREGEHYPRTSESLAAGEDRARIAQWLDGVPTTYLALNAAVAVIVPLFAPEQFLPGPLEYLRKIPPIVVAIGFLITWTTRKSLRRNLPRVAVMMCTGMVFWIVLLVLFVRGPIHDEFFLVGYYREPWVEERYSGWTDEAIIDDNGGSWGELHEVWGRSFTIVTLAYSAAYIAVLLGVVASLGGSTLLEKRRRRTHRVRSGEREIPTG